MYRLSTVEGRWNKILGRRLEGGFSSKNSHIKEIICINYGTRKKMSFTYGRGGGGGTKTPTCPCRINFIACQLTSLLLLPLLPLEHVCQKRTLCSDIAVILTNNKSSEFPRLSVPEDNTQENSSNKKLIPIPYSTAEKMTSKK